MHPGNRRQRATAEGSSILYATITGKARRSFAVGLVLSTLFTAAAAFAATAPLVPIPPPGIAPRAPGLGADELNQRQASALAALRSDAAASGLIARFDHGNLHFLQGRIPAAGADAPARARSFLDSHGHDLLRLGPNSELRLQRTDAAIGLASFRQRYRGLPVIGGELQVFTDANGVYAVLGSVLPGDGLDVTPSLDEHEVLQLVEKHGGRLLAPPQLAVSYVREPVVGAVGNVFRRTPRLVWIIPCIKEGDAHVMHYDAHSGEVLREVSMTMDSVASNEDYDADWYDAQGKASDDICQTEAGPVEAGDEDGLLPAYADETDFAMSWTHTRRAYAFYYDFFGRNSYDDDNGLVIGHNRGPDAFDREPDMYKFSPNAYWTGGCNEIVWTQDFGGSDAPVHEFAHGITQFTSDLDYRGESGALNESFSDVMAAVADNDGAGRWLLDEDSISGDGPLRSLANPVIDHRNEFLSTTDDNGGVHRNSGIGNKAAYLLAEGGVHPDSGYAVTGIGVTKMGKLLYAAYTGLTSDGTYSDLRDLAVAIASWWSQPVPFPYYGFSAADVCSVRNAFRAVGVNGNGTGADAGGDADCDGIGDYVDEDADSDGMPNSADNCDGVPNPDQSNNDVVSDQSYETPIEHTGGDACDPDDDNDGVLDVDDNCPTVENSEQYDNDGDGIGNACDDDDGDGVLDRSDNCPTTYNPGQEDSGGFVGLGDACDGDGDSDGVFNSDGDNCPLVANTDQADADSDFFGDACDGCPNQADIPAAFGFDGRPLQPDSDGDGTPDACDGSLKVDGPGSGGGPVSQSQMPQPGAFAFNGGSRITLPLSLSLCTEPCVAKTSAALVGSAFALDLEGLMTGVTAMVTDENGKAWARSRTLSDGSRRLFFSPRGDRRYFLTLLRGANAPESGQFAVRSFLQSPTLVSPADVAASASGTPDPVSSGSELRYAVQAANETFSMAEGVALRVTLPAGAQLQSAPGCSASEGELLCDIGELAAGTRAQREVVVTANGCPSQPLSLTARVESGTVDPVPENDVASAVTQITDGTGPAITALSATPNLLWPPNHRMRKVDLSVAVADACDAQPRCRITGVTSNEVIDGPGDGNTVTDWQIVDADTVNLRAERSGEGRGREYDVAMECADTAGNTTRRTATVRVPYEK